MRYSDIAYVVIHLRMEGDDYLVLHRHLKWGDWSLVGGHVEPGEEADWRITAIRETQEEMAPLRFGHHFDIYPLDISAAWGPAESQSAFGAPTMYRARYFLLRFFDDPGTLMRGLEPGQFRMFPRMRLRHEAGISFPVILLLDRLRRGGRYLPFSWHLDLPGPR